MVLIEFDRPRRRRRRVPAKRARTLVPVAQAGFQRPAWWWYAATWTAFNVLITALLILAARLWGGG